MSRRLVWRGSSSRLSDRTREALHALPEDEASKLRDRLRYAAPEHVEAVLARIEREYHSPVVHRRAAPPPLDVARLTARGLTGPGGGLASHVEAAPEWRATTVQACGLWPFPCGSGAPMVGVPLGYHLLSSETVCCDPVSWFHPAGLISRPSAMLLALPGLGKSTVARRMMVGLAGAAVWPLVVGDLKGEHVGVIRALGGRVVALGRGQGTLNVLDPGSGTRAAQRLTGNARTKLLADVAGRTLNVVSALVALNRRRQVTDLEETILSVALRLLSDRYPAGEATIHELVGLMELGPQELRDMTLDRGDDTRYREAVDPLQRSLLALTEGALGQSFAARTTVEMDLSGPLCVDISGIGESDEKLAAAALLACWAEGFGAIAAASALADAGAAPQRNYLIVVDELWRVLRASGSGMVDRIDALTRLDRHLGTGTLLITHTFKDLLSVPDPADAMKARGFLERVGLKIVGGLPAGELEGLDDVVGFSERERQMVVDWSSPPSWDPRTRRDAAPAGRGKFLLKVGGRPGIPFRVALTPAELSLNDTNQRWGHR